MWSINLSHDQAGLQRAASPLPGTLPGRSYPILAVTAPKNDESEQALGNYLFTALGLPLRGRWSERKYKLMREPFPEEPLEDGFVTQVGL